MNTLHTFYRRFEISPEVEECYYLDMPRGMSEDVRTRIMYLLEEHGACVQEMSSFPAGNILEIGPRLTIETPFSSNSVQIFSAMGITAKRIEHSVRYGKDREKHAAGLDRMTESIYETPLLTFETGIQPEGVSFVDIIGRGEESLREANKEHGLGMDDWDICYYSGYFRKLERNPTIVECFQLGNANSEHSRHWFFRGIQQIDGVDMPESLMDIVKEPWKRNSRNSLVAFRDNAGVIQGGYVNVFTPRLPGQPSSFEISKRRQHTAGTGETHNLPTYKSPFRGAETGVGGEERDKFAIGRGAHQSSTNLAGYCTGTLHNGIDIPGETIGGEVAIDSATPLQILIEGSDGVSDYGNKLGVPLTGGFCRSFGQIVDGWRYEFRKPILYCAGLSRVLDANVQKRSAQESMLIIRIGGPAYRIGVGGGAASSIQAGESNSELDLKAVQRGNAQMENRVNRVIRACAEMGERNPIESIHDQGAGGPSNVITELMEPAGGRVDIRKIIVGDRTMSVLEIWVAEYQEGYGILIQPERLPEFQSICRRERVNCEVLGEITGDGNVVVTDSQDGTVPVHLSLKDILSEMPQKTFASEHLPRTLTSLVIPKGLTVESALEMVFRQLHVGSKGFLVRKADRSVTGLVARQQCCGPMQLPVADASVTADGFFGLTGAVAAIGEQPIKMLIDQRKGARLAVAEMLTNMMSTRITDLEDVKCRANWMWAAKLPGQGALLYDAAVAMRDIMLKLGIAADGGKDSLSMAAKVGDELVLSPGSLVILGYAPVPDISRVCTPDFKHGKRSIGHLDLGEGLGLGGSALAQALGQLGDECADVEASILGPAFQAVQELVMRGHITACHDVSDGGLITTVVEMCLAGNRGAYISIPKHVSLFEKLYGEKPGIVFEYDEKNSVVIRTILGSLVNRFTTIGNTRPLHKDELLITQGSDIVLSKSLVALRHAWEATSTRLELEQANPVTVREEEDSFSDGVIPDYKLSFTPVTSATSLGDRPKTAIIREEGTNGDREMASACYMAGLDPWDITMQDILDGRITSFDDFRFMVFPGGFSFADVFGSAKGWAAGIRFNPRVNSMFEKFYSREDTISLGVCNGCQLAAHLGVLFPLQEETSRPILTHNQSGRFESRWVTIEIRPGPSIFLAGMEKSRLGIWVAHGEGRFLFPNSSFEAEIRRHGLAPIVYVDSEGKATEKYPYNPNGSRRGVAALSSPDGRHLAMMPHPERCFLPWQWPWMPETWRTSLHASPWLRMFQNARTWCTQH
ncbi:MAG: phosphoribosylformylglycinamidine synthase [Minisyncoccia bacterium]